MLKVEEITPDVPLPGLKQKGKEAEAIGKLKGPQSGPGAADQVTPCPYQPCVVHAYWASAGNQAHTNGHGFTCSRLALTSDLP